VDDNNQESNSRLPTDSGEGAAASRPRRKKRKGTKLTVKAKKKECDDTRISKGHNETNPALAAEAESKRAAINHEEEKTEDEVQARRNPQ